MKRAGKKLCGLVLALMVALGGLLAAPMAAGAVGIKAGQPNVTLYTTTVAYGGHKWLVIGDSTGGVSGGTASQATLLHSKDCGCGGFGDEFFNTSKYSDYEGGELQVAMNAISFAAAGEQGLVLPRTLDGIANDGNGTPDATLDNQKFWPLTESEYNTVNGSNAVALQYGSHWWLRSPDSSSNAQVGLSGGGLGAHHVCTDPQLAVRPAFILNLAPAIFTSDASGASAKSSVAAGNWSPAAPATDAIKLTLPDSSLSLASATVTGVSGNTITFDYTGSGSYNRLSAIVQAQDGTVTHYGNIKDTPGAIGSGATVTVPGGLAATDKLLVFVEQVNADTAYMSDFASAQVPLTRAAPAGLTPVPPTTYGGTDGQITGTTADMEYSADGTTWTSCTVSPTTGLAAGSYQVRYKAVTIGSMQAVAASPTASVTVGEGVSIPTVANIAAPAAVDVGKALSLTAPAVTWNGDTGSEGWEISENGTSNWTTFAPATAMTAVHNGQHLRYFATNSKGTGYSNTVTIAVNAIDHTATETPGAIGKGVDALFKFNGEYANLSGVVLRHENGNSYPFTMTPDGGISKLVYDGKDAGKAESGSVKVTLYASWLDLLPAERYTLTVTFTDNAVQSSGSAGFTLTRESAPNPDPQAPAPAQATGSPQTGDAATAWPLFMAVLGTSGLGGALILRRRKR